MSAFDDAHRIVCELAASFRAHESRYLSPGYQEAEVRKDFIDKFFIALGWDVNHDTQKNPYEQEVKVERGTYEGRARKRADYAFFLAPNFRDVRFFVEAKKPSRDFGTPEHYFQTLCYGWGNKSAPFSALTSFDDFHILDCRFKPNINDTLSRLVERFSYTDYPDTEKFSRIYWLFSREAVANGSLEKFAAARPKPKSKTFRRGLFKGGDVSLDDDFLEELDGYRQKLAQAFKKKDPDLNSELLTEVTQRTLDRLVFTRFLEDKTIEPPQVENFGKQDGVWEDFITASLRLNRKYNGIVYKEHAKLDAPGFEPEGQAFARICEELSDPTSPYNFNTIPIHILGSIYERFLGKVISDDARVVEKPEVRKAGGVYYTPEYIVRYIVDNTVGKLIEGKSPAQVAEMRFADIACGSGSFLLGVYDLLLRYHTKYYNENPGKVKKGDCVTRDGNLHLSIQEKRTILTNNIFGVDIDRQAVEVAQLSLYLKLLEDETIGSTSDFQTEFHYTLLPALEKNIVCGNSLIGADIMLNGELSEEEEKKLNPMDFEQRFPETMKRGGFDVILGNPPWISLSGKFGNEFLPRVAQDYLISKYEGNTYMPNMYEYFVARGLTLTRNGGLFGYIVPDRLGFNSQFIRLRKRILDETQIRSLWYKVPFPGITADTLVYVFSKQAARSSHEVEISEYGQPPGFRKQSDLVTQAEHRFEYKIDPKQDALAERIQNMPNVKPLSEAVSCTSGFGGKSELITEKQIGKGQIKTLKGDSIGRY
ncbi:MAG: N-6 DNA methylase, partial [Candidatus Eremiobacteraeota bacterium]|nr:N-6 DNA methylase [Candidatus Eremiobacteraeota bacterium]